MNRYFIENSNTILRKILNNEENLDIVQNLIESILNLKIKKIVLRPYLGAKAKFLPKKEKFGIVNVRVLDKENKEFNIGIQIMDGLYLQEKILTYGMAIHVNQVLYEDYNNKVNTITINFLDFKGFRRGNYHKIITFLEGKDDEKLNLKDEIKMHTIELPYYNNKFIETTEDEWLTYIKGDDFEKINKIKEKNQHIKKLDEIFIDYWKKEDI